MTPTVGVIMPVYNAHLYVAKAIESVLQQTYQDFELILVDDGATDGSAEICNHYAAQDGRIVLIHEENGGICKARNVGLKRARGKYIAFCDHDDLYMPYYLEKATQAIKASGADMVKFAYRSEHSEKGKVTSIYEEPIPDVEYNVDQLVKENYELFDIVRRALWNGLYKSSTIRIYDITFEENVRAGMEDFIFNFEYLSHIKSIKMIPDQLFIHFVRKEQSTFEKYSFDRLEDIVFSKHKEQELFKRLKVSLTPYTLVQYQYKYLCLIKATLNHPDSPMKNHEKVVWIKKLHEEDGERPNSKLFPEIKKMARSWPGMAVQLGLYTCKCYYGLLLFWKLRDKKN